MIYYAYHFSWVKLFQTKKSDDMSRLIVNAKELSGSAQQPPAFSFPAPEEIRNAIQDLGPAYYIACDLRQLVLPNTCICNAFARTLGIWMGGAAWKMVVLPMGHAWSASLVHRIC